MDASTLLETIASSKLFANDMKGVAMGQCTVSFITSTATVQPKAEELAHSTVLEGTQTLGETVGAAEGSVWLHILDSASTQQTMAGKCCCHQAWYFTHVRVSLSPIRLLLPLQLTRGCCRRPCHSPTPRLGTRSCSAPPAFCQMEKQRRSF
jgi:hypothetical protein